MSVIKAFSNSGFRSDENIPTTQSRESSTDAVKNDNNNTESATDHPFVSIKLKCSTVKHQSNGIEEPLKIKRTRKMMSNILHILFTLDN